MLFFMTVFFFFFKQKTAYEMRISDWSSDVCSSDLAAVEHRAAVLGDALTQLAVAHGSIPRALVKKSGAPKLPDLSASARRGAPMQIGRASCRERVCQYV